MFRELVDDERRVYKWKIEWLKKKRACSFRRARFSFSKRSTRTFDLWRAWAGIAAAIESKDQPAGQQTARDYDGCNRANADSASCRCSGSSSCCCCERCTEVKRCTAAALLAFPHHLLLLGIKLTFSTFLGLEHHAARQHLRLDFAGLGFGSRGWGRRTIEFQNDLAVWFEIQGAQRA